jgi:hypothetical protein
MQSDIVYEAVAEKHARWQKAKTRAKEKAAERIECSDNPEIKEWTAKVRAELNPHEEIHCEQVKIFRKHVADIASANPADKQDRFDWLIIEARKRYIDFKFTITFVTDNEVENGIELETAADSV